MSPPTLAEAPQTDVPPASAAYGRFAESGREYRIHDWRTPRPWCNVIANRRCGLAVSQTGSGFTWVDNSQLGVITRWQQEFTHDAYGKFLYVRDVDSGELWSLTPAPCWPQYAAYECRHGIGYTRFLTTCHGISAEWTLFVDAADTIEYWHISLRNQTDRPRRLQVISYLEWNCGVAPSPRREFHKLFIETKYVPGRQAITAHGRMWDVPTREHGHWNADFPYVAALGTSLPVDAAEGDKTEFFGRYGDPRRPAALEHAEWRGRFGQHHDAIAALRSEVKLAPNGDLNFGYALVISHDEADALAKLERARTPAVQKDKLAGARAQWDGLLASHRIETPQPSLNYLVNDWVRYQAISGRIWGRAGYYQQSGAYGFRDQLQDSQVWLTIDPAHCRSQLDLHARHQFADGSVYHWWHPLSEQGLVTRMTDDLLWLSFVTANYLRETADYDVLAHPASFLDDPKAAPLHEHIQRAFNRTFARTSARGLPFIGWGDWNDGLSAVGRQERGESVWLGQFLYGLLRDWSGIYGRIARGDVALPTCLTNHDAQQRCSDFERRAAALNQAINTHAWDGDWYIRATLDSGALLGARANRVGKIFLNAQTWAILNDVADAERQQKCWQAVKQHLIKEVGALLLTPAFDQPDQNIGYITRYAPGLRENGGVYTHAATWAIAAAAKMRDGAAVGQLLEAINPAEKDPERYWAEPYVLPGNVDGPESPYFGRGGWTWYTGSAQWLHRIVSEWVLGVRPDWNGLRFDPCLPPSWSEARMERPWRGCTYRVAIRRGRGGEAPRVWLSGQDLVDGVAPPPAQAGKAFDVEVII